MNNTNTLLAVTAGVATGAYGAYLWLDEEKQSTLHRGLNLMFGFVYSPIIIPAYYIGKLF